MAQRTENLPHLTPPRNTVPEGTGNLSHVTTYVEDG
jgi:hypothetical protein